MSESIKISNAEWRVMDILWQESPLNANQIVERVPTQAGWNHRTVKTLINRLVKKEALTFAVDGKAYLYRPAVTKDQCVAQESESFVERVFDGAQHSMLAYFVEKSDLSEQEIQEFKAMLDKKKTR